MDKTKQWFKSKVLIVDGLHHSKYAAAPICLPQQLSPMHKSAPVSLQVIEPGRSYITSGAEPKQLALSAAVGWCCGLCPLLGSSALCSVTACLSFPAHSAIVTPAQCAALAGRSSRYIWHSEAGQDGPPGRCALMQA